MVKIILLSILAFLNLSCISSDDDKNQSIILGSEQHFNVNVFDNSKKIKELLDLSILLDSVEFNNQFQTEELNDFLFFKSGYFLKSNTKHALFVTCDNPDSYSIKLLLMKEDKWVLIDSINTSDAYPSQFDIVFADYNFDKQQDIYIQLSASMGYSISRGFLILVNPMSNKLEYHKEAEGLGNMVIDHKNRVINSFNWNGYNQNNKHKVTIFSSKWISGQLKLVSKRDTLF